MLITPHALTGAVIATLVPNITFAVPLAISSHFILDMVPHWQETLYPYKPNKLTWIRIPLDLTLSIGLVWWISQAHPNVSSVIWLTAFAANIPDLDSFVSFSPTLLQNKIIKSYWDWHNSIQKETSSLLGLVSQLLWSWVCLYISFSS
ncbi:MAG: hypothetical protein PHQ59_04295 [Candidatus Daviesbacteria bacterium]|nr:hypothetical protein [Candidatus Daviesbacteria bacterium]